MGAKFSAKNVFFYQYSIFRIHPLLQHGSPYAGTFCLYARLSYRVTPLYHILNLEISKKKFHLSIQHNGARKMGVKNPKIFTPKVVSDPNSIFKNHYFVTYKPILEVKASSRGTISYIKSTLRYQKKNYTRDISHMGACFWE